MIYDIPGWDTTGINFDGNTYTITLTPADGSVTMLNQWAQNRNMTMLLNSDGATLTKTSHLHNRPVTTGIYPLQQLVYALIDKVDAVLPEHGITLGSNATVGNYKTTELTVQLNNISPGILNLVGRQLAYLPVKIKSAQISINQGMLSGTLQLTVLGN